MAKLLMGVMSHVRTESIYVNKHDSNLTMHRHGLILRVKKKKRSSVFLSVLWLE